MAYTALLLTFGLVVVEFKFCLCRVCEADRNTNGCSTPMGMNAPFKREFTPACDKHDICYGCVSTCFVILSCCVYCVCVRVRVRVIERSLCVKVKFSTSNVWSHANFVISDRNWISATGFNLSNNVFQSSLARLLTIRTWFPKHL